MKHPRQHNENHLQYVRGLPCVVCGNNVQTEAAHVRMPAPWAGKRPTGMGEKPDDAFTVPLCGFHHREQHQEGEKKFWLNRSIDPVVVALALWKATGDYELGEMIIRAWR